MSDYYFGIPANPTFSLMTMTTGEIELSRKFAGPRTTKSSLVIPVRKHKLYKNVRKPAENQTY